MGKAAHVGSLNHEVLRQFPRDAEIHDMGVGSMHVAIQAPGDGKSAIVQVCRRDRREGTARSGGQNIAGRSGATLGGRRGNEIYRGLAQARAAVHALRGRGIVNQGGQAEGAVAVEAVDDALAEVVVVKPISAADRKLAGAAGDVLEKSLVIGRRPSEGDSGGEISVVPVPKWWLAIRLTRKAQSDQVGALVCQGNIGGTGIVGQSLLRQLTALTIEGAQVHRGRHLVAVHFVRRLQQGVASTKSQSQSGSYPQSVLGVPLRLVGSEMARDESAARQQCASLVAVIFAFDKGNEPSQRRHRQIVGLDEVTGDAGEAESSRIQTLARSGNTSLVEPGNVGLAKVERIGIAQPLVIDDADATADLEGVLALGPGYVVHQVMHGNGEAGGGRLAMEIV